MTRTSSPCMMMWSRLMMLGRMSLEPTMMSSLIFPARACSFAYAFVVSHRAQSAQVQGVPRAIVCPEMRAHLACVVKSTRVFCVLGGGTDSTE
jgi:hypothetical protein